MERPDVPGCGHERGVSGIEDGANNRAVAEIAGDFISVKQSGFDNSFSGAGEPLTPRKLF